MFRIRNKPFQVNSVGCSKINDRICTKKVHSNAFILCCVPIKSYSCLFLVLKSSEVLKTVSFELRTWAYKFLDDVTCSKLYVNCENYNFNFNRVYKLIFNFLRDWLLVKNSFGEYYENLRSQLKSRKLVNWMCCVRYIVQKRNILLLIASARTKYLNCSQIKKMYTKSFVFNERFSPKINGNFRNAVQCNLATVDDVNDDT